MKALTRLALLLLFSISAHAAGYEYRGIRPDVVIDVRTPAEYASGHIAGAINIPVERIGQDISTIKALGQGSTILLYCRSGRRSAAAADILNKQGYLHVVDGGGYEALSQSLKPCSSATC